MMADEVLAAGSLFVATSFQIKNKKGKKHDRSGGRKLRKWQRDGVENGRERVRERV